MTPCLIVKKIGMTRILSDEGDLIPVTLMHADSQKISAIRTDDQNGYNAVQVAYYPKKEKRLTQADLGRIKPLLEKDGDTKNFYSRCKEFRAEQPVNTEENKVEVGQTLDVSQFEQIDFVDVTGFTKGRGFQGTTKRYNTARGPMSHGSKYHRRGGSLGQRSTPGKVYKNKRMPGHMGTNQITVKNLKIIRVDKDSNTIAIRGSVPGNTQEFLYLKPSRKGKGEAK